MFEISTRPKSLISYPQINFEHMEAKLVKNHRTT